MTKLCDEVGELKASRDDEDESAQETITLAAATEGISHENHDVDPIKVTDKAIANMGEASNLEMIEAIQNVLNRASTEGNSVSGSRDDEKFLFSNRHVLRIKL